MKNEQEQVKQWMTDFGQHAPDKPTIPDLATRQLRAKLILEEALETIHALGLCAHIPDMDGEWCNLLDFEKDQFTFEPHASGPDLIKIADGCADLIVVTKGTNVACGIPGDECFAEVMRSNNSKMWTDEEIGREVYRTREEGLWGVSTPGSVISLPGNRTARMVSLSSVNDRCWLVKDASGKIQKSPSYSPANLKPILEGVK